VLVLESENAIGTGTSSRNSEVIHAGIYYPAGPLKARLCVQGKQMLYAYCAERGVAHQRLGKLIVATSPEQVLALDGIMAKAAANGVHDLQKLTAAQAQALEPALACEAALLSPSTGVIDSHGFMLALQGDMENAGGLLALVSPVQHIGVRQGTATHPIRVTTQDGTELACKVLVNAAGGNDPKVTVVGEKKFEQIALADWKANYDLNMIGGAFLPCQEFGAAMASRGKGSIINIASVSAHIPLSRVVAYSAAKAAVLSLTQFLAREWAKNGVRVNSITPGFFPAELAHPRRDCDKFEAV
jgi:NAD(P)-dependent dehydrogenase (short-subunit alcohol dehydrogenase family)